MLIKARQLLNKDALITFYYSFLYPYFTYCNSLWGAKYATSVKRLNVLQKRAIRFICGAGRYDSTYKLYDALGIVRFPSLNVYLISKCMYKWYNDFYVSNREIYQHNTRQNTLLHTPQVKNNLSKFSIRYRGAHVWNNIMKMGIKPNTSEAVFMKCIRIAITNNTLCIDNLS